jgi:uncharacterized membrane protein YgcG
MQSLPVQQVPIFCCHNNHDHQLWPNKTFNQIKTDSLKNACHASDPLGRPRKWLTLEIFMYWCLKHEQECFISLFIRYKTRERNSSVLYRIRNGPLDIWRGGGLGNFSVHEFFFIRQLLARILFSATFLCTIFFLRCPKQFFPESSSKSSSTGVGGGGGGGGGGGWGRGGINFFDCRKTPF